MSEPVKMTIVRDYLLRLRPAMILIVILLALDIVLALIGGAAIQRAVTEAMIYIVVVVGLYMFVGTSGVISFGHIGFMMLGAYVSAWQSCCAGLKSTFMPGLPDILLNNSVPVFPAAVVGGLAASAFALIAGLAIMRLTGIAASIATLAMLAVMKISFENWESVTAGHSSIIGLPIYVDKWVGLAWASAAIVAAAIYHRSRAGLSVRLAREDEVAARASGVNVYLSRLIAFVLSAFFVGVGGALYGHYLGTIAVDIFWLDMTFITLAMLVVGGMSSISGAVAGVLLVVTVSTLFRIAGQGIDIGGMTLRTPDGTDRIILAVVMLVILGLRPRGITGGAEVDGLLMRMIRSRRAIAQTDAVGDAQQRQKH